MQSEVEGQYKRLKRSGMKLKNNNMITSLQVC